MYVQKNMRQPPPRRIISKKSLLVLVAFMFLIISSMDSISSMFYMNWRKMRVLFRISGDSSSSSRRVPLLLSSIAGNTRFS